MANGNLSAPAAVQGAETVQTKVVLRSVTHLQVILRWSIGLMFTIMIRASKAVRVMIRQCKSEGLKQSAETQEKGKAWYALFAGNESKGIKRKEGLGCAAPPPKKG